MSKMRFEILKARVHVPTDNTTAVYIFNIIFGPRMRSEISQARLKHAFSIWFNVSECIY